jgi:hypothetical protein
MVLEYLEYTDGNVDTGGKFDTGIRTPAVPVSGTPAVPVAKFAADIVDTGGKFATRCR